MTPETAWISPNSPKQLQTFLAEILAGEPAVVPAVDGLAADWISSPLGSLIAVCDSLSLHLLEFHDRKGLPTELKKLQRRYGAINVGRYPVTEQITVELKNYFSGNFTGFNTPLALHGSTFTRSVWSELQKIPVGETRSYQQIARLLERPTSSRAVARANGANQISIAVPCHRLLGADGSLTGYGGGLWRKQWLIDHERKRGTV